MSIIVELQPEETLDTIQVASKKVLHVGCGLSGRDETHHRFKGPEWFHTRLDIDPSVKPDVISDIRTLDGVSDASFDGLYSSHNLEHLHFNDVFQAIGSFYRVLKDRGLLVVVVPDFGLACEYVSKGHGLKPIYNSPAGPITPLDMIFGYRPFTVNNPYQQHKTGFTKRWLGNLLVDMGFVGVETITTDGFDIWGYGRKIL